MVVIFANKQDHCAQLTYQVLQKRNTPVFFVEDSQFAATFGMSWFPASSVDSSFLVINDQQFSFAHISGALVRLQQLVPDTEGFNEEDLPYVHAEFQAVMTGLLHAFPGRVVNRPRLGISGRPLYANQDRLRGLVQCGFQIPLTLVTANAHQALQFYELCHRFALLSSPVQQNWQQLIQGDVGETVLYAMVSKQPVTLQAVSQGQFFEIFIVGEETFGASSTATSASRSNQEPSLRQLALPPALQRQCRSLAQALQLDFVYFFLQQTAEGKTYGFAVDDLPGLDACTEPLRSRIITSLASLLTQGQKEEQ